MPSHRSWSKPGKHHAPEDNVFYAPNNSKGTARKEPIDVVNNREVDLHKVGISLVGHVQINIRNLLNPFNPTADIAHDVSQLELLTPLVRPYGCGPVAPEDWMVLRTYGRIIEVRDGLRMDDSAVTVCDRDFKRFYQEAVRSIGSKSDKDSPSFVITTIENNFRGVMDKLWHRYMFPFGSFAYHTNIQGGHSNDLGPYKKHMHMGAATGRDGARLMINPYSVSYADILYLCNTIGYPQRFLYTTGIILWAKKMGVNLLLHRRYDNNNNMVFNHLDRFYTLEKYLHVFGSIWLHIQVLQSNKWDVGGGWAETRASLEDIYQQMLKEFDVNRELLEVCVQNMTLKDVNTNVNFIQSFFRSASRLSDSK